MSRDSSAAASGHAAPLRLGYLIDSLVTGGAERLVLTFADAVRQRPDVKLTVFVLSDRRTPFREALEASGIELVPLPGRTLLDPVRFARLLAGLRDRSIEYLHAHLSSSTTLGAPAALILGIPFATTIHNVRPSVRRVSLARKYLYRAAVRLPGVQRIAVGHAVAEAAKVDVGARECIVVPNAISKSAVAPAGAREEMRRALELGDDDLALLAVGAIIGQKAYEDLLSAFAIAARRETRTVLLIAGHPPEPARYAGLLRKADELGIARRVRFLGLRTDIPQLLAASDLFVSASHWEGAPVSLLEAMANGLACVVTDVGENRRVLAGTGSVAVPARDPAALAAAILQMIGSPELRRQAGAAGQRRAVDEYDVSRWVERLLDVYASKTVRTDWRKAEPRMGGFPAHSSTPA